MAPRAPAAVPLGGDEERLLIEAAKADPRRSFELYERNFDRVYAFVARRAADRAEAEGLTSEVFHQALAHLGRFEWRGIPFAAWLLQIARNAVADRWNRAARERGEPSAEAVDQVYRAALEAGAESLYAPVDQPYGDREAGVKDVGGNHWYIATRRAGGHIPEGLGTVTAFLHPRGAPALIDFITRAFGAEPVAAHREPDGRLAHAVVRLGASAIEMGEAHDQWGPMPTMFYAYVDDVDAWYRRALDAGATSIEAPALQPYGERRAAVRDRFDNQWYLAAPAT